MGVGFVNIATHMEWLFLGGFMAKYRLCYLEDKKYRDIDLSKLECLEGHKYTELKTIDNFTTCFENGYDLLDFLRRNGLISNKVDHLYITMDKKKEDRTINSKIYKGEYLLFKKDRVFLEIPYIYKWFIYNQTHNPDILIKFCDKSIKKYIIRAKTEDEVDKKTSIVEMFEELKGLIIRIKDTKNVFFNVQQAYDSLIDEVYEFEFYTDKSKKVRKYKNIHDFVIFLKSEDINLYDYKFRDIQTKDLISIKDNSNIIEVEESIEEEFLTSDEIDKMYNINMPIKKKRKGDEDIFSKRQRYDGY